MFKRRILTNALIASFAGVSMVEKNTLPFEFVNLGTAAENDATPRINIYERIGESMWEDGLSARAFVTELAKIDDAADIDLHLSTVGGDTMDGTVMYNALMDRKGKINAKVTGYAISMGSVLAMAGINSGGTTTMSPNALMMIHKPGSMVIGNADEMREQAKVLDMVEASLSTTYVKATGKTIEDIAAMLSATTWMTADEALENGFITSISEKVTEVSACLSQSFVNMNPAKFAGMPASFINQFIKNEDMPNEDDEEEDKKTYDENGKEIVDEDNDKDKKTYDKHGKEIVDQEDEDEDEEEKEKPSEMSLERKRCAAISTMCNTQGFPAKAQRFIDRGTSLEDAQDFILELKASIDENIDTKTDLTNNGPQGGSGNWELAYKGVVNLNN
jgi:ATP-dependent protease ClpP protease subunit